MLRLGRVTKLKMFFLVLVFVFNFDLFKFSAAILEKGLLWISSMNRNVASRPSSPCHFGGATQITWIERVFLLVDSYQHTFANRSHVKYEFTNTKKFVKKLARIEASSICRQQLSTCLPTVFEPFTHTNLSLPTWVCQHEFANFCLPCEGRLRSFRETKLGSETMQVSGLFVKCIPGH